MIPRNHILGTAAAAALTAGGILTASAPAAACTPPRLGPSVAAASEPWRRAVEALREEAAAAGQPWSCAGGALDIVAHDGGARLTVTGDDGRAFSREVSSPDDVVPLGEAMLAKPLPLSPSPAAPAAPPREVVAPPVPAGALAPPRVLVSALVAPRYAGGARVVLGGITAAAAMPFGPWVGGAWLRYDALSVHVDPHGSHLTEVCFGASAGRSFALAPVELRASALASVAIVTRPNRMMGTGTGTGTDETHVSGRFGLDARGVLPITSLLRAVVALDAEIDPRELAAGTSGDRGMKGPPPQSFPGYTLGVGVGMEIALR